ncbi:putative ribonuclease H domain-containing protein [Arabidopsis thaliana]
MGIINYSYVNTALEAETKALLVAMQQAWIRGYKRIQFEGDCEVLINAINGKTTRCELPSLLRDVDYWALMFSSVVFQFTKNHCNSIAHQLASPIYTTSVFQSYSGIQPRWLKHFLCKDLHI